MGDERLLIIEKGEPYEKGTQIRVLSGELMLGRPWKTHQPDISFTDLHISKSHALLSLETNRCTLTDLGSKLGTQINGYELDHNIPFIIKGGDIITLAKGIAVLRFMFELESDRENTIDLDEYSVIKSERICAPLLIDSVRREVLLDGKELGLSGKDLELLLILYENCSKAVSYNEIRNRVWPERPFNSDINAPDVGNDEINALVYRLRKRLGKYGSHIYTIPRYGYRLDM